jgi:hypothetical protein
MFKNNSKNLLTIASKFAKLTLHTVLEQQHTLQKIMRKTLLIAAAALAGSIISSEAQVYSQNVVGYANIGTPVGGHEYLITCPFAVGVSNGINEIFGSTLSPNSQLLIWNGTGYNVALYDPTYGPGQPVWYQQDDSTPLVPLPTLPTGEGFFLIPNAPITNVFAGAVSINVGSSNQLVLPTGGHEYLVASVVPYAGAVTNGISSTGGPNLNGLSPNTQLLFWNGTGFNTALYDNTYGPGAPLWYQQDDSTPYVDPTTGQNTPSIAVGQGFFLVPNAPYTWTTGL